MNSLVRKSAALALLCSAAFSAPLLGQAIVPTVINYQAYVTETSGASTVPVAEDSAANRLVFFRFYNKVGTDYFLVYSEQQTCLIVDGMLNTLLGQGTPISSDVLTPVNGSILNFVGVFQNCAEVYVGLSVSADALTPPTSEVTPRQRIVAAPFALRAVVAESVADNAITSASIANGSIQGADLASGTLTGNHLANGTLTETNFTATAVSNALQNGGVGTAQLANDAVTSPKIKDGTITGADIADSSITGADIAPNSLGDGDIGFAAINGWHIADRSVYAADIAPNVIGSYEIGTGAVGSDELINGSVRAVDLFQGAPFAVEKLLMWNGTPTNDSSPVGSLTNYPFSQWSAMIVGVRSINTPGQAIGTLAVNSTPNAGTSSASLNHQHAAGIAGMTDWRDLSHNHVYTRADSVAFDSQQFYARKKDGSDLWEVLTNFDTTMDYEVHVLLIRREWMAKDAR